MRTIVLILVTLCICGLFGRQADAEPTLAESFGFPTSNDGGWDLRVWISGGILVPEKVYRLYQSPDGGVRGHVIAWLRLHVDDKHAGKPTNSQLQRLMRSYCDAPRAAGQLLWCDVPVAKDPFGVTLNDLQPVMLWSFSDEFERDCGWMQEDGESVTVDLIRGHETHRLSLGNPDFCCSKPVCAFVNHARDVVERNMPAKWGKSKLR